MQHPLAARGGPVASPPLQSLNRSIGGSINGRNRRRAGSTASVGSGSSSLRATPKLSPRSAFSGVYESSSKAFEAGDDASGIDAGVEDLHRTSADQGLPSVIHTEITPEMDGDTLKRSRSRQMSRSPLVLRGMRETDLALIDAALDQMDEEELVRFLLNHRKSNYQDILQPGQAAASSTPRARSTSHGTDRASPITLTTPRPLPRRSLTTSSSTSLPIFPVSSGTSKPYMLLGSPDIVPSSVLAANSPRTKLPHRQSSMTILTLTKAADESPLFPPSPPPKSKAPSRDIFGAGDRNTAVEDGMVETIRALSRVAREMQDIIRALETENEGLRGNLATAEAAGDVVTDGSTTLIPKRASLSSARSLLLQRDDQSINESLNEAISTSLGPEFLERPDHISSSTPRSRAVSSASTHAGSTRAGSGFTDRNRGVPKPNSELDGKHRGSPRHGLDPSNPPPNHSAPSIRVRPADKAPRQKSDRSSARASWTSGLWTWNSPTADKARPRASSRSTSGSGVASPASDRVSFEPAPSRPSVSAQRNSRPFLLESEVEEEEEGWQARESSPAFKAIVLATRVMTPDPSSVLHKPLPPSSLIAYLAHSLITQAREDGVRLKGSNRRASVSLSHKSRDPPIALISPPISRKPTSAVTTTISNAISNSFGAVSAAIGAQDRSQKSVPDSSSAARKALLRTLSTKAGHHAVASALEEAEELQEPPVSSVELNALIAPENRPPTMLLRRSTINNRSSNSSSMKVATQFATSDILDYTDRYGFVYDMRYVRMLLDLKAAAAEVPQETPGEDINREFFAMRVGSLNETIDSVKSQDPVKVIVSPDASPPLDDVDRLSDPPHRARANTVASFKPSPVKSMAVSQDVQVSARGSADLQPRVPSGNWRTYSGSIQIKANNLEKLATLNRKPISVLLGQLSEVHDRQEVERQKSWQAFVKDRQHKTRSSHGRKATISVEAWSSVANAFNPSKSKVFVDDQKWQGASLGISQMGLGKSGTEDIKRFFDLVRETGIPIVLRPSVWWECTGAMDAFVPGEYQEILSIHAADEHPVLGEIEKDVGRTFPTNVFFGGDGVGCRKLRRLLTAYAWHDPSIGYCQGMNLLAATLLLTYDDEEKAYWTLLCLIKNLLPEDWFTSSLTGSMTEQAVLSQYVDALLPEVARHLSELGLDELSSLTFGWLLSVFTSCLPIDTLLRVWDCFIVCGKDTILRMAMAILSLAKDDILACESAADVFECLNGMTEKMWGADKLIHIEKQLQASMKSEEIAKKRTMHARMLALNSGDGEVDLLA